MLSTLRRFLGTWVARLLFIVLVASFAVWGVGDVLRNMGHDTWVARIGGHVIEAPELQEAYQREMAQVTRAMQGQAEPTPEIRRSVLNQTLERLVMQAAIQREVRDLGLLVPDEALREAVFQVPGFRGPNGGQFDKQIFQAVLRANGLNEPRFLSMMREDLGNRQLMEAVRAGAAPPDVLTRALFEFENERRSADIVALPFATAPLPAAPTEAQLRRWWENHPDLYSTPEYRRVKAVVLSPETLAKDIQVSDEDLRAAYDQHKADYVTPEKRSARVITVRDEARARAMAEAWRNGADWASMQAQAKEAGGSAVELDDATREAFPSDELGAAVFAAAPGTATEPTQGAFGWAVISVLKSSPGSDRSFEAMKDELRSRVLAEKAADIMYDRANKLDNLLASGTSLDQLPDDLGLVALTGTLDAQGNTAAGQPAPIPGPPELREAMVQAAFQAAKGEPPRLVEVQTPSSGGSAYYALTIEDITPAAPRPFDQVRDQVAADWSHDAIRHEQEEAAAKLLTQVKAGQTLADAAADTKLAVRPSPLTGRGQAAAGVPPQLLQPLFALKPGQPTMVETPEGFLVAVLAEVQKPAPNADPAGFGQLRDALTRSMGNDTEVLFASALRDRAGPQVNRRLLDTIIQQP